MAATAATRSYSQLGQDLEVVRLTGGKRGGFFVDVGAHDGVELSNTFLLEKDFGWSGVCIEPNPAHHAALRRNRSGAAIVTKAAFSHAGTIEFSVVEGADNMLSGISSHLDAHRSAVSARQTSRIAVATATLTDILNEHRAPAHIDYLSIDVEGAELEVLRGIDFQRYTFGAIDLEHNYIEPRRTQMRDFLATKGYALRRENRWDDSYAPCRQ